MTLILNTTLSSTIICNFSNEPWCTIIYQTISDSKTYDLAMINSKQLIKSGLVLCWILNDFLNRLKSFQFAAMEMQLIPRIWLSLFYSSDPNSQTSNWLKAAEYILCNFIEHGLQIHQSQPCFPGKNANHRRKFWISQGRSFREIILLLLQMLRLFQIVQIFVR